MAGAYIAIILGVAVWAAAVPFGNRLPDAVMRGVTVFGGAFLLAVCFLGLLPEAVQPVGDADGSHRDMLPFAAVLGGFLFQQLLDALSAHAEHGHTEHGFTVAGLMVGLSLHALLEGMPLVAMDGEVNRGLMLGIIVHNIPVALVMVGLFTARGYGFWRVLALLSLFGLMSPLGSLFNLYVVQPDAFSQRVIVGLVVGVLLHVSSSILFDHKRNEFSWTTAAIVAVAFATAYLTVH